MDAPKPPEKSDLDEKSKANRAPRLTPGYEELPEHLKHERLRLVAEYLKETHSADPYYRKRGEDDPNYWMSRAMGAPKMLDAPSAESLTIAWRSKQMVLRMLDYYLYEAFETQQFDPNDLPGLVRKFDIKKRMWMAPHDPDIEDAEVALEAKLIIDRVLALAATAKSVRHLQTQVRHWRWGEEPTLP